MTAAGLIVGFALALLLLWWELERTMRRPGASRRLRAIATMGLAAGVAFTALTALRLSDYL